MLHWLRRRSELAQNARHLYERIVAQARSAAFYRDLGVPDTMEGRFEMIALHMVLVRERLKREGADGQRLGQMVLEHLIADMDDALRQFGYDMGVPRRVKKAAAAFGDRAVAYGAALAERTGGGADDPLTLQLTASLWGGAAPEGARAAVLAAYVRQAVAGLHGQPLAAMVAGDLAFPKADAFATAGGSR